MAVLLFNLAFEWLWRLGDKLERRSVPMVVPKPAVTADRPTDS